MAKSTMRRVRIVHCFFVYIIIFVLHFSTPQHQVNTQSAGVILTFGNSSFVNGFEHELPNYLLSYFDNTTIPEIAGTTRELLVFEITYNLTDIHINDIEIDSVSVEYISSGFQLNLGGISCSLECNWSYSDQSLIIIHVSGSGNATMSFTDGSYQMQMLIEENNGSPYLKIKSSELDLSNFDLQLDSSASQWFYDFFNFIITPLVRNEIESVVEEIVQTSINDANNVISQIPVIFPLIKGLAFNWGLTSDFDTSQNNGFGSFFSSGYFVAEENEGASPPFSLSPIPSQVNFDEIQLIISQYTCNSLGWALYEAGDLNITIPLGTTKNFRVMIPALYRAYPDDPLQVNLVSYTYPGVTLSSGSGFLFEFAPYMNWNVLQNSTTVNAFVLLITMQVTAELSFDSSGLLHGKVAVPSFNTDLYSTSIGDFSLLELNIAFNTIIGVVTSTINLKLNQGIAIPTIHGLHFNNPQLEFGDGFMFIATSIDYESSNDKSELLLPYYFADVVFPMMMHEFYSDVLSSLSLYDLQS